MSVIGNLIWIIFGGLIGAIIWVFAGTILCITVVGIPFGLQCFKIAGLQLAPFGREVKTNGLGPASLIFNILWIIFFGWEIALFNIIAGIIFCITVIGIPFGLQSFKLASVSLLPFGTKIE